MWSGGFFGIPALAIFQDIRIPIIIAIIAFLLPIISLLVISIYESKNEQFAITDTHLITLTANKLNVNTSKYSRSDIKEISVEQSFIGDIMGVGDIVFEVYQTDMETDGIVFEGIDNPYDEISKLKNIIRKDLKNNQ